MILYVNGDSHTAAAEAVNPCAFAEDAGNLEHLGRRPHPANLAVSWGKLLSDALNFDFHCDAESASSNTRIIRTTKDWIANNPTAVPETLFIIQWSTWERQEWLIDGTYYQVNASGVDSVPDSYREAYKEFIINIDYWRVKKAAHATVWNFHNELKSLGVRHIFFNADMAFNDVQPMADWGICYVSPYEHEMTYSRWLKNNGFNTVSPNSYHFGKEAHSAWAKYMLQYIIDNHIL